MLLACFLMPLCCCCLVLSADSTIPWRWLALLRYLAMSSLASLSAALELWSSDSKDLTISFNVLTRSFSPSRSTQTLTVVRSPLVMLPVSQPTMSSNSPHLAEASAQLFDPLVQPGHADVHPAHP